MRWSYADINWEMTRDLLQVAFMAVMVVAGFSFTLSDPDVQSKLRNAGNVVRSRYGLLILSGLSGLVWLAIVAFSDKDGFTGQTAAAWVQAVGSVAAIVAAIVIDGRAAKRLENHQRKLDDAAGESRVVAILNAAAALRLAADDLDESIQGDAPGMRLATFTDTELTATAKVLSYHLGQTVELNPGTLEGLALAETVFAVAAEGARGDHSRRSAASVVRKLRDGAGRLDEIAAEIAQETARV